MNRPRLAIVPLALALAACSAVPASPSGGLSVEPSATASAQMPVPAGRILFMRRGSDGVEHYFTIRTDGSDEQALFDAEGCSCAHWSADGTEVLTLGAAENGTWSLRTIRPDGSGDAVVPKPVKTLNLAAGASTADGRLIAFNGWDETDPANTGLWVASPDLNDLRMVMPLQEGMLAIEPFGVTPDGSQIVFFAETGSVGETTHAGDIYVVNADGSGMRQLNPLGTKTGFIGPAVVSLSPDGRQATFGLDNAIWVVDLAFGDARPITEQTGFVWAASWSPTGEWIAFTRQHGTSSVVALVRPDGTDDHEIAGNVATDETAMPMWSPDGNHVLVRRGGAEDGDLWIMDLEGTYVANVTHEPSDYGLFSWATATTN
jgi:WD40 repeat protein